MASDNEHIALRRRMEKRLGRDISDAAWSFADHHRYVASTLEEPDRDAAEDELAEFLSGLLLVRDDALLVAPSGPRRPTAPQVPDSKYIGARIQAVSRLAAEHAAGDRAILEFRRRVLKRDSPMSSHEAEAYLDLPEARGAGLYEVSSDRPLVVLDYQNARFSHTLHVWQRSPLDRLHRLAAELVESYPWQPAQAAAFVLEGQIPLATPFMLRFPQPLHEDRPRRARLVLEVDLWMPAARVLRAYRELQRQVLPGHNRPVSRRSVDLVNFVLGNPHATWQERLERWNTEHPTATYADYRSLRTAFDRARRSLLYPRYRTYFGK